MSVAIEDSKLLINRAKTIAAMGMVERDYEGFNVVSPGVKKETFRVWRDESGRIRCSCPEFENRSEQESRFRCEHIFAVKFHLEPPDEATGERRAETNKPQVKAQEELATTAPHAVEDSESGIAMPFAE